MLRDKDNVTAQAGFIGGLGLVGFLFGSLARRGRFFKRLLYTSAGAGGAASLCYPAEANDYANLAWEESKKLSLIAYNFVAGVQPEGDVSKPKEAEVLSDDDKTFLSSKDKADISRDQSNPADKDMYTTRDK